MDQKKGSFWSKSEIKMGVSGVLGVPGVSSSKHETAHPSSQEIPAIHSPYTKFPFGTHHSTKHSKIPPPNPLSLLIFILPAGGRGGEKLGVKMANYLQFANGLINFVVKIYYYG